MFTKVMIYSLNPFTLESINNDSRISLIDSAIHGAWHVSTLEVDNNIYNDDTLKRQSLQQVEKRKWTMYNAVSTLLWATSFPAPYIVRE